MHARKWRRTSGSNGGAHPDQSNGGARSEQSQSWPITVGIHGSGMLDDRATVPRHQTTPSKNRLHCWVASRPHFIRNGVTDCPLGWCPSLIRLGKKKKSLVQKEAPIMQNSHDWYDTTRREVHQFSRSLKRPINPGNRSKIRTQDSTLCPEISLDAEGNDDC